MNDQVAAFADALPGMIWTAGADGRLAFVNRCWCEYTGISVDEAATCGAQSVIHPEDLQATLTRWHSLVAAGEPGELEARLRCRDGSYRWFRIAVNPMRGAGNQVVSWCGINTEIDEGRSAARPPDAAALIESIPMMGWVTRADGYMEFANRRWLEYAGVTADRVAGWGWQVVIHPDDLQGLVEYWKYCLATGTTTPTEARMRRFDGAYRWFLFLGNPVRDATGKIVQWFGTNVDIEDRKRAEEGLRESQRTLAQIINALPMTAWSALPDGYCDFLSDRWIEYAGVTREQAMGWGWARAVHPDDVQGLEAYWRDHLASGELVDYEARIRRHDGEYRWFLFRATPLRDESGTIVKWFGTNLDIEDRKRADEAVRESQRSLIQIIDTLPSTAWSTLPDGFCDYLNKRWLEYAGMTAEEARGWSWGAAIHPDDVAGLVSYWQGCLASGTPVDTEARMRRHDGEYRWFLFRANPLRDAAGTIVKWYGTNVDIEDRKRAEEELRRSQVLLAEGQRVSRTGSFYWRVDSDHLRASDELYRILGVELGASLTLEGVAARVHPEDQALFGEHLARARRAGAAIDHEMRLGMQDGSFKHLRLTAYGTRDRDQRLEYVGAIQDVTERRTSEDALARTRSELAYMTRVASMGALTASIAHEVNQPLQGIITNAGVCQRMLAAEPPNIEGALETSRRMHRDGHRAIDVITRLRALFGKRHTATESVDLNQAIREVIALSMSEMQRNRVTVRVELGEDLPPIVGDRIQLQQVILNLIMNASGAMSAVDDRPRLIMVTSAAEGAGAVRVSVEDTGVGIGGADSEKVFDAFYTTKADGMGIGLSVSRSIIENHEGRLWARPNDGPGATFAFVLPAKTETSAGTRR